MIDSFKKRLLPNLYLITGSDPCQVNPFLKRLEQCLLDGLSLVQLRAKELSLEQYRNLAAEVIKLAKKYDAKVLLNTSDPRIVMPLNADGIHVTSHLLMQLTERPVPKNKYFSAACHNEDELKRAASMGADLVTLSPVLPTRTHPDAPPLGWDAFKQLCSLVDLPIFALGGLSRTDLETVTRNGGYGIAGIDAFWGMK